MLHTAFFGGKIIKQFRFMGIFPELGNPNICIHNFILIYTVLYPRKLPGCRCWQWISPVYDTVTLRISSVAHFLKRISVSNSLV